MVEPNTNLNSSQVSAFSYAVASTSEESESDDGTVTIREGGNNKDAWRRFILLLFSQEEYHYHFVPKNPLEIAKGLQNTTVDAATTSAAAGGIAAVAPLQLDNFSCHGPNLVMIVNVLKC